MIVDDRSTDLLLLIFFSGRKGHIRKSSRSFVKSFRKSTEGECRGTGLNTVYKNGLISVSSPFSDGTLRFHLILSHILNPDSDRREFR